MWLKREIILILRGHTQTSSFIMKFLKFYSIEMTKIWLFTKKMKWRDSIKFEWVDCHWQKSVILVLSILHQISTIFDVQYDEIYLSVENALSTVQRPPVLS